MKVAGRAQARARPRRIPAFGEWNYYDGGGGGGGGDWPVTQYFDSAMQAAGVVMALPPSPKQVKKAVKWSDSPMLEVDGIHGVVVGQGEHGAKKQGKQSRVSDTGAHTTANYKACSRVVKAVDEDLYDIPPDMLCHKPRNKRVAMRRSIWRECLGFGCIV